MTETKKQPRTKRSPAGDSTKKIVSLTLDPTLIAFLDHYAVENNVSRSKAVELATALLREPTISVPSLPSVPAVNVNATENSLVQSDGCIFASPSIGQAIFY